MKQVLKVVQYNDDGSISLYDPSSGLFLGLWPDRAAFQATDFRRGSFTWTRGRDVRFRIVGEKVLELV